MSDKKGKCCITSYSYSEFWSINKAFYGYMNPKTSKNIDNRYGLRCSFTCCIIWTELKQMRRIGNAIKSNQISHCGWTVDKWKLFLVMKIWHLRWALPLEMNVLQVHTDFTQNSTILKTLQHRQLVMCQLAITFQNQYALCLPLNLC